MKHAEEDIIQIRIGKLEENKKDRITSLRKYLTLKFRPVSAIDYCQPCNCNPKGRLDDRKVIEKMNLKKNALENFRKLNFVIL